MGRLSEFAEDLESMNSFFDSAGLNHHEGIVYLFVAGKDGGVVSSGEVRTRLHMKSRTVSSCLRNLVEGGYLSVDKRGKYRSAGVVPRGYADFVRKLSDR